MLAVLCLLLPAAGTPVATIDEDAGPVRLEIRSADPDRVLRVRIDVDGRVFGSLGVLRPSSGTVQCGKTSCTVTTPAVLTLTPEAGEARISAVVGSPELEVTVVFLDEPESRYLAHGHSLWFSRDSVGQLSIRAHGLSTRF
jgi:hypothetical protein